MEIAVIASAAKQSPRGKDGGDRPVMVVYQPLSGWYSAYYE